LEALAKFTVTHALQGDEAAMRFVLDQLAKLPHDAFVRPGDGIYTIRYNEAQKQALEGFIKVVGEYKIPESEQDGGRHETSSNRF
jgi:hypothetical protein